MYYTFKIPKKDGTTREISAPDKALKEIQRKLADVLSDEKNNVGNAEQHTKKRLVLNIAFQMKLLQQLPRSHVLMADCHRVHLHLPSLQI